MSWVISMTLALGWEMWVTAKMVYPRRRSGATIHGRKELGPDFHPPLTMRAMASPLGVAGRAMVRVRSWPWRLE